MTDMTDTDQIVRAGEVEIDLGRRLVRREREVVSLTRTEWILLEYLATNAGKVLFTAEVLGTVWGPEYEEDTQYLRVWISRLRRKLEVNHGEPPAVIKTMQGIGYMLDAEPPLAVSQASG